MVDVAKDVQMLRALGSAFVDLDVETYLGTCVEDVALVSDAWPAMTMSEAPESYNRLTETVGDAAVALYKVTSALGNALVAIADHYARLEESQSNDLATG